MAAGTPVLLLHGFPTSSHDFAKVWPHLARRHALVTLDFVGFGLSDKPAGFGYGLFEQADIVLEVLRELGVRRAHVIAHDMGTSIATELCARRERGLLPLEMASLTLTNGSVFVEMAHLAPAQRILRVPKLGDWFARVANYTLFRRSMRKLFADPDAMPEDEIRAMWALFTHEGGHLRAARTIDYVAQRRKYRARWNGALERLDLPTLILWGAHDPVAVLPIAERLAKVIRGSRLRVLEELGHYPQIEGPERFAAEVEAFLGG